MYFILILHIIYRACVGFIAPRLQVRIYERPENRTHYESSVVAYFIGTYIYIGLYNIITYIQAADSRQVTGIVLMQALHILLLCITYTSVCFVCCTTYTMRIRRRRTDTPQQSTILYGTHTPHTRPPSYNLYYNIYTQQCDL